MRENRTSGSMSGDGRRSYGGNWGTGNRAKAAGQQPPLLPKVTAPILDSTEIEARASPTPRPRLGVTDASVNVGAGGTRDGIGGGRAQRLAGMAVERSTSRRPRSATMRRPRQIGRARASGCRTPAVPSGREVDRNSVRSARSHLAGRVRFTSALGSTPANEATSPPSCVPSRVRRWDSHCPGRGRSRPCGRRPCLHRRAGSRSRSRRPRCR